jgi:hypothetical protein
MAVIDLNEQIKKALSNTAAPAAPQAPAAPSLSTGGMQPIAAPGTPTGFGQVMQQPRQRVDEIAADMMKEDSPLMRQAETRGLQAANRRGLLNSSIAVGEAQRAQLDAIAPLAGAEADQRQQDRMAQFDADTRERLQKIDIESRERLARMDLDANNRRGAEGMISNILSLEQNTLANIMANTRLSASERQRQIQAAEQRMRSQMDLVEGLFQIDTSIYTAQTSAPPPASTPARSAPRMRERYNEATGKYEMVPA